MSDKHLVDTGVKFMGCRVLLDRRGPFRTYPTTYIVKRFQKFTERHLKGQRNGNEAAKQRGR